MLQHSHINNIQDMFYTFEFENNQWFILVQIIDSNNHLVLSSQIDIRNYRLDYIY